MYGVVAGHLETFLARQRERGRHIPALSATHLIVRYKPDEPTRSILREQDQISLSATDWGNSKRCTLRGFGIMAFTWSVPGASRYLRVAMIAQNTAMAISTSKTFSAISASWVSQDLRTPAVHAQHPEPRR